MSRPGDGATTTLAAVREAVQHVWTFYAARLLSPALAHLLAPFHFLDEVDDGLDDLAPPAEGELLPFHAAILRSWRRHHMPSLEGLAFDAVPVSLTPAPLARSAEGTRWGGDLGLAAPSTTRALGPAHALAQILDHRGVALECGLGALPTGCEAIAIVPRGEGPSDQAWLDAIGRRGVLIARAPAASFAPAPAPAVRLRIDLRVQDARVFLLGEDDAPLRRGVAELGYFRDTRAASKAGPGAPK
jgi:hypothetical protein